MNDKDISLGEWGGIRLMEGLIHPAESPLPPADGKGSFKISLTATAKAKATDNKLAPPTPVNTTDYQNQFALYPIFYWGKDNLYPNKLDEESRKCNILENGLKVLSDTLYGQGLYLYKEVFKDGEREIQEVEDSEVSDFLYDIRFEDYFFKACHELPRWGQIVPVYRMRKDGKLGQLFIYDTYWCRLEKPDPTTALIENVYVTNQWWRGIEVILAGGTIPAPMKPWVKKIALLKDFDPAVQMAAGKLDEYCQWIGYHTSGYTYRRAPWHAAYENRWTGISASVPALKIRLSDAALTINYMIGIHEDFWKSKYENWNNPTIWDKDKKAEEIKRYQKMIEENLSGKDNAFKTLFYSLYQRKDGTMIPSLKVDVINNQIREGTNYISDMQASDGQILMSLGLDPSMLGFTLPGGSTMGGGSGSNIREAYLALNARLRPDRELLLKPFYTARDFNWPDKSKKDIKIGVRDYIINTLDARAPAAGATVTTK